MDSAQDFLYAFRRQHAACSQERHRHNGGSQGLVFAMPVRMIAVGRTRADTHEEQHYEVREQVTQRMHGIGNHRG